MWRGVPGYLGLYEASDEGEIRSVRGGHRSGRVLSAPVSGYYRKVVLVRDGVRHTERVHRLVALTFLGLPGEGQEVRHLDGDSLNNAVSNLQWGSKVENRADMTRHGRDHNAVKVTCKRGHLFTAENTAVRKKDGKRECRACIRVRYREGKGV